ncbi:MAG TPA: glycerophosphoryl diester phosphodiesterase membrane domain-containing protein [Candidatus Methylomirabilis sp.]|nr:glycerophosphoryl diester phosphodiesterase membrane domain-containing protein [Candidatus Methylomirabilis sp.]
MAGIDLRPMTLGEVLDRTFTLYRERFLLFAGISALPYLVLLLFRFGILMVQRASFESPRPGQAPVFVGGFVASLFGTLFLTFILVGIAEAATVWAVSELYLGREASVGAAYSNSKARILVVLATILLVGLATFVGLIFLIIPGIYLACRLALAIPAVIVEQESPTTAMERSWQLTDGHVWEMFLLLLLVWVISYAVGVLFQLPVFFFAFTAALAKQPVSVGVTAYSYVAEFVSQVLAGPVGTISASLMYYNLRVRKEGFDIQHLLGSLGGTAATQPQGI